MSNRTRYAAALAAYRNAEAATYGTRIGGGEFACRVKDECGDLEVVTVANGTEYVTERALTPAEWADGAERATSVFCNSYTVRNTLHPYADKEREMADFRSGIAV